MTPDGTGPTVPPFDQVAVAVAPGSDLVVRLPGVLLVVAAGAPAPPAPPAVRLGGWTPAAPAQPVAPSPSGEAPVGELVDLCRRAADAGSRAPGRRLHEELRTWLPSVAALPSFALAAATEEGLAVALVGAGTAEVPDLGLRLTSADGELLPDGTPFLDRLVDWPPAPLRLSGGGVADRAPHPLADLRAGAVPGAAAVLFPAAVPAPSADAPTPAPAPVPDYSRDETAAPAPRAVELPAPARSASLLAPPPDDEVRAPLPVLDTAQPPAALAREPEDPRPRVKGFLCPRGHLNDPRLPICAMCGLPMADGALTDGIRPPLGLLVFDNGATVTLDADYLLGREPDTDERVRSGQLRPLTVVDPTGGVSRHHAELRLEGWDVVFVDVGSANGTLIAFPGAQAWQSLVPHQPVRLLPGAYVRMGGRQFSFESAHGAL